MKFGSKSSWSVRAISALLVTGTFLGGCASQEKAAVPAAAKGASDSSYKGLGKESLSPETIRNFSAPAIAPELSRRIQNLLDVRSPGAGMLHPNKKSLFFSWRVTGVAQVWRLDSPLGFPIQMTGGEDSTSLAGMLPNGEQIILSRDRAGEENPGLYLQSVKGGPLTLIQHKEKVQTSFEFASSDSKYIYYRANDLEPDSYAIYRYRIADKKTELIYAGKGYWSVADHKEDGRLLLQKSLSNSIVEVYEYSPKTKMVEPVLGLGEKEDYHVSYGAAEGEYFVLTPKFGDFKRLYHYQAGEFKAISPEIKWDVSDFYVDFPKKHLMYSVNEGGYTKLQALDAKTLRNIKLPEFKKADHVAPVTSTRDGKFVILSVTTSQAPRLSYSYEWTTGKLTQWLLPSAPEVDLSRFASAQLESYRTRDGVEIPMFVRRPEQCQLKNLKAPCPVVVHFHGGPEGQSMAGFQVTGQMFVDAGFIYVEPNVRGSEGYGKAWLHLDDGAKRLNVLTDIPDAASYIKEKWSVAGVAPKIGVMGWSYGGYSTQIAMTKFAGSFDAGVSLVGMSNLQTFLLNTAPYRRALRAAEYGDPEKDAEAMKQLSAINYIDQIKAPMMLIQGVSDPRVPVGEAVQMYELMKAKGLSASLILFADEGHGSQKRSNQVLELGNTIQFFKTYLK